MSTPAAEDEEGDAVTAAERLESGEEGVNVPTDILTMDTERLDRYASRMAKLRMIAQQARAAQAEMKQVFAAGVPPTIFGGSPGTHLSDIPLGATGLAAGGGARYPGSSTMRAAAGKYGAAAMTRHAGHFGKVPIQAGQLAAGVPAAEQAASSPAAYNKAMAARRKQDAARRDAEIATQTAHERQQAVFEDKMYGAELKRTADMQAAAARRQADDETTAYKQEAILERTRDQYLKSEMQRDAELAKAERQADLTIQRQRAKAATEEARESAGELLGLDREELKRTAHRGRMLDKAEEMHGKVRATRLGRAHEAARLEQFAPKETPLPAQGTGPPAPPSPWPDRIESKYVGYTAAGVDLGVPINQRRGFNARRRQLTPDEDPSGWSAAAVAGELRDFAANPPAKMLQWFTMSPVLGKLTFAIFAVAASYHLIERQIQAYFAPGGAGDVRKMVRDAARQIDGLRELVDYRAGRVFFGASTRVEQAVPSVTYTESLRDGELRYRSLHQGSLV